MKVYISGKITGLPIYESRLYFLTAKVYLECLKHTVINPFDLKPFLGIKTYFCYMISDLWNLMFCDAIYMLPNWKESRGARIENAFAKLLGLKIIYQKNLPDS